MIYNFGIQIGPREINKKLINLAYKSALFKLKSENKILNSLCKQTFKSGKKFLATSQVPFQIAKQVHLAFDQCGGLVLALEDPPGKYLTSLFSHSRQGISARGPKRAGIDNIIFKSLIIVKNPRIN